jgi:zinc transport system substrate-binding protein
LIEPGQDPHTFEPSPRQVKALSEASLYFTIGLPLEQAVVDKIRKQQAAMTVVDASQGVEKRLASACCSHDHGDHEHGDHAHDDHSHDEPEHDDHAHDEHAHDDHEHAHGDHAAHDHAPHDPAGHGHKHGHDHDHQGHDHHGHDHGEMPDPHVWMSPPLLKTIAGNMTEALAEADPEHAADYRAAGESLIEEIDALHEQISGALAPYQGETFYVFHPAFGYFAETYGLQQVAVETGGQSPTPRQLRGLIEQARADGVDVIFVQEQFDRRSAETVAQAIGGAVVPVDPLEEDVLATLRRLAEQLQAALDRPGSEKSEAGDDSAG